MSDMLKVDHAAGIYGSQGRMDTVARTVPVRNHVLSAAD